MREYALSHPTLVAAGEQFLGLVTGILDDAGINYLSVTGRTKTVASFAEKARRTRDGERLYEDPLREITDTIGVRVITYVHSDVAAVAGLLHDQVVVHDDRDMGRETAQEGRFGYASRHLLIGLDAAREGHAAYELLRGRSAQVQVRTVLQHAWAEFEHDIRYKGTIPDEHVRTSTVGSRSRPGCSSSPTRSSPRSATRCAPPRRARPMPLCRTTTRGSTRVSWRRSWPGSTPTPAGRAPTTTPGSPDCCSSWASSASTSSRRCSASGEEELIRDRMGYHYPPGAVRRLDDALLSAYGSTYVGLRGNAHRRAALEARLEKLTG